VSNPGQTIDPRPYFDLGHQGDVDVTVIAKLLTMTPTQRLHHHEGWRSVFFRFAETPNFLEETVIQLTQGGVEYVIVGGVSAVLQGASIVTRDLDICYRRTSANIARLVAALGPLHPRPRGFPPGLPFTFDERTVLLGSNFTLEVGDQSLDLLGDMSAIGGYEEIIGEAKAMQVGGYTVKVLSLAQLIATKQAAGRPKDLAALPILQATLELQQQRGKRTDDSGPSS
jgi:hypothetical protein